MMSTKVLKIQKRNARKKDDAKKENVHKRSRTQRRDFSNRGNPRRRERRKGNHRGHKTGWPTRALLPDLLQPTRESCFTCFRVW